MISFEGLRLEEGQPIYQQIVLHVKRGVVSGAIADGDELPSRRILSAVLGVNPNTVQKACRALEEEGLIASHAGAKSYVAAEGERIARVRAELLEEIVREAVAALKQMGVTRREAAELAGRLWDQEEKGGEP